MYSAVQLPDGTTGAVFASEMPAARTFTRAHCLGCACTLAAWLNGTSQPTHERISEPLTYFVPVWTPPAIPLAP